MKNSTVIASLSSYYVVITTTIVMHPMSIFFEMDNAYGEGENFVVDDDDGNDKSIMTYSQQQVETECKSPCSSSAEMCIAMCA